MIFLFAAKAFSLVTFAMGHRGDYEIGLSLVFLGTPPQGNGRVQVVPQEGFLFGLQIAVVNFRFGIHTCN